MQINVADFARYATARGARLQRCPVCQKGPWTLNTTEEGRMNVLVDLDRAVPSLLDNVRMAPFMTLQCQNCSYTLLFRREPIAAWLEANPA